MVGPTQHHGKSSKHLAVELKSITLHEDDMFTSHDVVSLFTNTPTLKNMEIIKARLQKDTTLTDRTRLEREDIMALLDFVLNTTYFSFRHTIHQHKFGTAMVSPVSPIVANLFMKQLEQDDIATAPISCRPRMWKRYVDDILEVIKTGMTQQQTDHLNRVDETNIISFTHEEEAEGTIPFWDTLLKRKESGEIKLQIFRKNTHADRYLNFSLHHPLHRKMGMIRTLIDRFETLVTEDENKRNKREHIKEALTRCGYPQWTISTVQTKMKTKKEDNIKKK